MIKNLFKILKHINVYLKKTLQKLLFFIYDEVFVIFCFNYTYYVRVYYKKKLDV